MILVILAAFFYSLEAILAKLAFSNNIDPLTLLTARFMIAAIFFWIYFLLIKCPTPKPTLKEIIKYLGLALTYGMTTILYFQSLVFLNASIAIMLLFTFPVFVIVGEEIFFGHPIMYKGKIAVLIILLGLSLLVKVFNMEDNINVLGLFFGLGSAITYATFNLFSAHYLKFEKERTAAYMITIIAVAFLFIRSPLKILNAPWNSITIIIVVSLALFSSFLALTFYLIGIEQLGAVRTSIISSLEPLMTAILAFIFLGESFDFIQILGASLIISGVILAEIAINQSLKVSQYEV